MAVRPERVIPTPATHVAGLYDVLIPAVRERSVGSPRAARRRALDMKLSYPDKAVNNRLHCQFKGGSGRFADQSEPQDAAYLPRIRREAIKN
jgi:hypothetical protein